MTYGIERIFSIPWKINFMKTSYNFIACLTFCCAILFILPACKQDLIIKDDNDRITFVPYEWKYDLHKGEKQYSNSIIDPNIYHEGHVILAITDNGGANKLSYVNLDDGLEKWKWKDTFEPDERLDLNDFYIDINTLLYNNGKSFYFLNLITGTTINKYQKDHPYYSEKIDGFGTDFYVLGHPVDTFQEFATETVLKSNFTSSKHTKVLIPPLDLSEIVEPRIGQVSFYKPYIIEGDTLISLTYQDIFNNIKFKSYLGLYNESKGKWIYNGIPLNEEPQFFGVVYRPILISDNKVYINVQHSIVCHELNTGERIWKKDFPAGFLFSGFIVKEGVLVANCENEILYGLDAETGNTLWEGLGAGTSSELEDRYLNGIVYFSGGSTSRIHAVDIHTGKTVWLLDANNYDEEVHDFKPDIYVIPDRYGGKGKVVITTHRDAYCLEAYR